MCYKLPLWWRRHYCLPRRHSCRRLVISPVSAAKDFPARDRPSLSGTPGGFAGFCRQRRFRQDSPIAHLGPRSITRRDRRERPRHGLELRFVTHLVFPNRECGRYALAELLVPEKEKSTSTSAANRLS